MNTKRYLNLLTFVSLCSLLLASTTYAYTQQGFQSYQELNGGIDFTCTNQCVIQLGAKGDNDIISINNLSGNGTVAVAVAGQNGQLIPISQQAVSSSVKLMASKYNWKPVPNTAPINLIFQGNISGKGSIVSLAPSNFVDNIGMAWKTFWTNEGQTFYGINIRYGHKLNGTWVVVAAFRVFILGIVYLYFKKRLRFQNVLYLALSLFLVIAIRNQLDYSKTTINNLKTYTFASEWSKSYGNLGDFYEFISKSRDVMRIETLNTSCKIYYSCLQDRPFCAHMQWVFLKPCEKTDTASDSDYQIYYKKPGPNPLGTKLLDFNGSSVYKTR